MYNLILPMAGNATRMCDMVDDIPKHLLPIYKDDITGLDLTIFDVAVKPLLNGYQRESLEIGAVIPCGTKQRNRWHNAFVDAISRIVTNFVVQTEPNGTFGAVFHYFNHCLSSLKRPTFVLLPDTISDISTTTIMNMCQASDTWMTVTPKCWKDGDKVVMSSRFCVSGVVKESQAIGLSPAGLFYFKDSMKLYGILNMLYRSGVDQINVTDVINLYSTQDATIDACMVQMIDCGNISSYIHATAFGEKTQGAFWG